MSYEIQIFLNSIAGLICNEFGKSKGLYVFMPFVYVSFKHVINGSSWICWSLGDVFFHFLTMVATSLDHQTFSTMRYFPPRDIFWTVTFWGTRSFPLRDTLGCNFFHHQTFSAMRHFPNPKHFQLQFLGSRSITSSWNMRKMEKRASYHCSDKIMFVRLIQNESLTPTPTPHEQVTPWGIFHRETFFEQYSINYQLPKYEKN